MGFNVKILAASLVMGAVAVAAGCSDRGSSRGGPEVVQAGYPAEDTYYDQGSYQGDNWVWRDRDGHEQRETRADHERRASVRSDHAAVDAGRRDTSNDHRDAVNNNNHSQPENTRHDQAQPGRDQAGQGRVEPGHEGEQHGEAAPAHGDENGADRHQ